MNDAPQVGVALLCDRAGTVLSALSDPLGLAGNAQGRSFFEFVDEHSREKSVRFFQEVLREGASFHCELVLSIHGVLTSLFFAGGVLESQVALIGAHSQTDVLRYYQEMMRINNEQANRLRDAAQESAERARLLSEAQVCAELTRLNNELVNKQRDLSKQNMELARLNEQKNFFLGMAAHDLRNPLAVIQSFSRALLGKTDGILDFRLLQILRDIEASSEFMLGLVNDLLDVSRCEAGRLLLRRQPTDPAALVRKAVDLNQVLAEPKGIRLRLELEQNLPHLSLDAAKISQVLNNLLSNAVKFSPPDSDVLVRVRQRLDRVLIEVIDHGRGMTAQELTQLFTPFSKAASRGTAGERGTGLGLAIAKKIVQGHGGEIGVDSEPSLGSTFSFTLPGEGQAPIAPEPLPAEVPPRPELERPPTAEATAKTLRVLLVEDNAINQRLIEYYMLDLGHDLRVAQHGAEALRLLAGETFDVALMDIHLGDMDGMEVVRRLRAGLAGTLNIQTPVVALTAYADPEDVRRFHAVGMNDHLIKPVSQEAVQAALLSVTDQARSLSVHRN